MAFATALWQDAAESSTHVCMTVPKPASFPPAVRLTSVVEPPSAPSCPLLMVAVVAPEQATNLNDSVLCAAAQSFG